MTHNNYSMQVTTQSSLFCQVAKLYLGLLSRAATFKRFLRGKPNICFISATHVSLVFLLVILVTTNAWAQMPGDGSRSKGTQPGAPAGSYTLSDFEQLNLFSGNLNFRLPLIQIGGRGGAKSSVNLTIDSMKWQMDHDVPTRENLNISWGAQYANYVIAPQSTVIRCTIQETPTGTNYHCEEVDSITPPSTVNLSFFSEYVGPTGAPGVTFDIYPVACGERKPGYGPGVLQGQGAIWGFNPAMTLTRLTFIGSDGTEYELRDTLTGGEPKTHAGGIQPNRGTVFTSAGGEGLTFVADAAIVDVVHSIRERCPYTFYPSGLLYFTDGTRYRINNGNVEYIQDANGNRISYLYDSSQRVAQITDSLGRQVIITYDNPYPATGGDETYDDIKYQSAENTWRHVKIYRGTLSQALRSGFSISSISALFGELPGLSTEAYNPTGIVTRVELPDGNRNYQFYYNAFGVLARVEVPTGGAVEYDRVQPTAWGMTANEPLVERRAYAEGGSSFLNTPPDQKQVYSRSSRVLDSSQRRISNVSVENYARSPTSAPGEMTEQLQSKEVHSYFGWPDVGRRSFYGPWREGLEFKSEVYAPGNTTPLRRVETEWQQPFQVRWFTQTQPAQLEKAPNNNPRVGSVTTWLMDSSPHLVSKQTFGYDDSLNFRAFNNRTDLWEYAFGNGAASNELLRHTQTKYLVTGTAGGPTPTPNPSPTPPEECPTCQQCRDNCERVGSSGASAEDYFNQKLVRLPAEVRVFGVINNQEQLAARTEFIYDEIPLTPRSGITGWSDPGTPARGNVTSTKRWITPADESAFIKVVAKYDIAGSLIEITDANNKVTTISFEDCFGLADGNAHSCTSRQTFAMPTSVTNSLGHVAYTKYDYYSGSSVTTEDANGVNANMFYNDALDRVTQVVSAAGTSLQMQTSFDYNDDGHTITTKSDLADFDDNKLKSVVLYDGLGRITETHSYENSSNFITTKQFYDGLGRVIKATNPYRTTGDSTYGEVKTTYDALGRVVEVKTTSDNASVTTAYVGNTVTVTDQAGKQRKSVTDALGRLTNVFEAPNTSGFNYETRYMYDALGNLIKVTQGPQDTTTDQTRTFVYDGLSRLTSATNPESGTMSYVYDANGNLLEKTDPRLLTGTSSHIKTNYMYDALNRVTKRSYNDGTPEVNYFYDAQTIPTGAPALERGASLGQLLAVTYGGGTSINGTYYGYDNIGRTIKSAQVTNGQTFPTMEYSYNLPGSMTSQKYPSGRVVTTAYDDVGRLSSLNGVRTGETAKTYVSLPEYGPHGAITALKLGNGLWERTSFNPRLQPTEIKLGTQSNQESVLKLGYSYGGADNNGNVKSQTITVPTIGTVTGFTATQNYEYDPLNRLKSAQEMSGSNQNWKQTYIYDRFGNRRLSYAGGATTIPAEPITPQNIAIYNPEISPANNNRLVGYEYDLAGNVTRDAQNRTFAYDAENHQIAYNGGAVINNGDSASYSYDGDGKRVKKQVGGSMASTVFVYNITGQLVAEYTDSQETRTAQTSYLTTDTLGSTRVVTGQDGAPKERHDYLPFGEDISAQGGRTVDQKFDTYAIRQRFTGYEKDSESGMDFAEARYYSGTHGRFTSIDPLLSSADPVNPQTWNRYIYCINNPLNCIDPTGLDGDYLWASDDNGNYKSFATKEDYDAFFETEESDGWASVEVGTNIGRLTYVDGDSGFESSNRQLIGEEVKLGANGNFEVANTSANGEALGREMGRYAPALAQSMEIMLDANLFLIGGLTSLGPVGGARLGLGGATSGTTAAATLAAEIQFTATTAARQEIAGRRVPLQILARAIQNGRRMADPQGAPGAVKIVTEMYRNGKRYELEIIYREADKTILHILYK